MKKLLTVILSLCLLASLATCFAVSAHAEEKVEVTVGQVFEWNDQSTDANTQRAWRTGKGTSPDGLWKYQFYSLNKKVYQDLVFANGSQYAWTANPGNDDSGIGYARVRQFGKNFHPAYAADVVKVFTAPSGGSIFVSSILSRDNDVQSGTTATGSSFAIYVEDRLVYPEEGNGEFLTLVSSTPQTVEVTFDVKAGERVRFHIGAIGDQGGDSTNMSNTITYKSINDEVAEEVTDPTVTVSQYGTNTYKPPIPGDNDNDGGDRDLPTRNNGISTGAVVGIVIGAVAVVAIAVVVVIVLKKKKAE